MFDYWRVDHILVPIGSMYGIYANIWGILMVNVTIYGIHGSYGVLNSMVLGISWYPRYPRTPPIFKARTGGFTRCPSHLLSGWKVYILCLNIIIYIM
jgi:hypothetical protein